MIIKSLIIITMGIILIICCPLAAILRRKEIAREKEEAKRND